MSGSNWTATRQKKDAAESSIFMTSGRTTVWKQIHELISKTPVVVGKIHGALLTAVCGFSSILQHERRADVAQSTSLPTWHQSILWHGRLHSLQICLKSLQAAQINWSLERNGTVNISALTENSFKAFLTELCDFTEDHPISKIHNQELLNSKCILLCVLALWEAIISIWKLPLHFNPISSKRKEIT